MHRFWIGAAAVMLLACGSGGGGPDGTAPVDATPGSDGGAAGSEGGAPSDGGVVESHPSGTADTTFGTAGRVERTYGRNLDIRQMLTLPGSKTVLVGANTPPNSAFTSVLALRLGADGAPDAAFGSGGESMIPFGARTDGIAYGVGMVPGTDKILLGGSSTADTTAGQLTDYFVMQLDGSGNVVTSFGTGGRASFDPNGSHKNGLIEVQFAADGSSAFLGISSGSSLYQVPSVTRVLPTGAVDTTYGVKGGIYPPIDDRWLQHVTFQQDGRLILCFGNQRRGASVFVERYDAKGTKEASGTFAIHDAGDHSACGGVAVQADGKIVVAGQGFTCATPSDCPGKNVLVRFDANLVVDASFDVGSSAATLTADGENAGVRDEGSGRALAQYASGGRLRTRRVTAGGVLDAELAPPAGYHDLGLGTAKYRRSGFAVRDGRLTTWAVVDADTSSSLLLDRFWL